MSIPKKSQLAEKEIISKLYLQNSNVMIQILIVPGKHNTWIWEDHGDPGNIATKMSCIQVIFLKAKIGKSWSLKQVRRKVDLCNQVMEVMNKMDTGKIIYIYT